MLTTSPSAPSAPSAPSRRGRRGGPLAVTAVAVAGLLASCASASTSPVTPGAATSGRPAPGPARAAASPASPAAGAGMTPGAGAAGAGTAAAASCRAAALRVTVDANAAGGAAGSTYLLVDFANTSAAACQLYGYPGMSLVTAGGQAGRQIGAAAQHNAAFGAEPVRLPAGGVAHAWLQVAQAGNYPPAACQPVTAHWLRVFAPGQSTARYLSHAFDACASAQAPLLTVLPVRAGQGVPGTAP